MAVERLARGRQRIFETGGAVEQHRALVAPDAAVGETLLVGGVGRGALRAHQEAFLARRLVERRGDRLVGDRDGEAAALAHRAQDQEIADRLRHADAGRDRVRVLPARGMLDAVLVGAHHGRAAGRLHRDHARALLADEADRLELGERLPHADQSGAAAGRIEDHVRHLPAELFGEFEPHRLLAFDAVGLLQRGGVEPADLGLAFGDDLAAIVDQPVDAIDGGALQRDLADVHLGRVLRAEDRRLDAAAAGIGGERRAGIAVGRHRHVLDAERLAHRHRHDQAARLEGAGGQPAFILHDELAAAEFLRELRQPNERRHRLAQADDVAHPTHRQQLAVAPEVGRALRERIPAQRAFHAIEVVAHQQRLAGAGEIVHRVRRIMLAGSGAFEVGDEGRPLGRQVVIVPHAVASSTQ